MKIRHGFVSNSSTSSYILFFPEEIAPFEARPIEDYAQAAWNALDQWDWPSVEDFLLDGPFIASIRRHMQPGEEVIVGEVPLGGEAEIENEASELGGRVVWLPGQ